MSPELELISSRSCSSDQQAWWAAKGIRLRGYSLLKVNQLPFPLPEVAAESLVVFTSQHAIRALWNKAGIRPLDFLRERTIAAIAPATSGLLNQQDAPPQLTAPHAQALAEHIVHTQEPQAVRYFCKPTRRPELPKILTKAGFQVQETYVYETQAQPQPINWGDAAGMIFYSPSAVETYLRTNPWPSGKLAFSIGPRTAQTLKQAGITDVITAAHPTPDSLLAVIQFACTNSKTK
ncbi:MAG: uroporphyrinogen-III synthase [Bacteroidota bacterium]